MKIQQGNNIFQKTNNKKIKPNQSVKIPKSVERAIITMLLEYSPVTFL